MANSTIKATLFDAKEKFFTDNRSVISRSDLLNKLFESYKNVDEFILPMANEIINHIEEKKGEVISAKELLDANKGLSNQLSYLSKNKRPYEFLKNTLIVNYKLLKEYHSKIIAMVKNNLEEKITPTTFSVKDYCVITFLDNIVYLNNFGSDFIVFLLENLRLHGKTIKEVSINKRRWESINNNLSPYISAMDMLNKKYLDDFLKNIVGCSKVIVDNFRDYEDNMITDTIKTSGGKPADFLRSNFVGNPFYHIGMFVAKIQNWLFERRNAEIARCKNIILELEAAKANQHDPSVDESIEYYQRKITDLEYKVKQYTDDLNK